MSVLVLSPYPERLAEVLKDEEHNASNPDWVICFGHREILSPLFVRTYRCINIHISFLPYNRGADPNFWSWFDDTPKGITIHEMTKGIDTGPILAQRAVYPYDQGHTLRTSYELLMDEAVELFRWSWPYIRKGWRLAEDQPKKGTYHRAADKERWMDLFPLGWDTPCEDVETLGRAYRRAAA